MNSTFTATLLHLLVGSNAAYYPEPPRPYQVVVSIPKARPLSAKHEVQARLVRQLRSIPNTQHRSLYEMGKLQGSSVGDLYAAYVGIEGKVPHHVRIDWNHLLKVLWDYKIKISHKTTVRDTGGMLVEEYNHFDPGRMSLQDYQAIADAQSRIVYRSLNWDQVGKAYFFDKKTKTTDARKLALLKRVTANIRGRTLIAYAMTELLPTSGGYGREYLDFLLRNGGRRYVESLPALHDSITSFGPFQFTAHAVFDAGSNTVGGASLVNRALPQTVQIPDSVMLLRGNDHLRAAELFAISNVAMFIRRLNEKHLTVFERIADTRTLELTQFIATAHNKPVVAYKAGVQWLEGKMKATYQYGCPKASRIYANKTENNYQSLSTSAI